MRRIPSLRATQWKSFAPGLHGRRRGALALRRRASRATVLEGDHGRDVMLIVGARGVDTAIRRRPPGSPRTCPAGSTSPAPAVHSRRGSACCCGRPARRSPRAGACESAAVHAAPRPRQNKTRRPSPGRRVLVCARVVLSVPPPLPGAVCVIAKRRQGATERALSGGSVRCPPGAVSNRRRAIRRSRCPSRVLRSPPPPAAAGSQSAGPRSTVTGRACRSCSCLR
ncbi:Uncharacterised protein [Burkholderia pseudomallei]|nr:Uncharacterised protein [Burkholderia pseudomallei]CAJ2979514.1 Uncharacterised protein [Burkholderia pseudomallei]CAJ3069904.1 Uncharacterised protein [Burkholderia pseudomallei]CAJ3072200.1 Uncharacterised protein [Burkholderia pseudomallei]CAJ3645915.1 Uncharacterised protein [Burkholderia pseudomallei]